MSFRWRRGNGGAGGHTGAGKTTIIQLLLRFYEVQRGQILLDDIDIRELDIAPAPPLRHRVAGPVPVHRHAGIERPPGHGRISRDDVRRRCRKCAWAGGGTLGLDAPVTERGTTYSVGQRQLISFARALAHDPRFLILDEATSSVDTQTEMLIREALDRLLTGRTAVVIAHRLSTIQRADQILVLHKGRLREQGSHQELLALRGIYYRLYQLQYKDQELPASAAAAALAAPSGPSLPADD